MDEWYDRIGGVGVVEDSASVYKTLLKYLIRKKL